MKNRLILLTVIVLGVFSVGLAQNTKNTKVAMKTNPLDKTLMDMERAAWNNLVSKNYDAFTKMFADDYQGVYPDEMTTKTSELAQVKQITFKSAEVSDIKISYPASNVAIVNATVKSEMMTPDGKTMNDPFRSTTVYIKRGSQWQIVYHSHIPIMKM